MRDLREIEGSVVTCGGRECWERLGSPGLALREHCVPGPNLRCVPSTFCLTLVVCTQRLSTVLSTWSLSALHTDTFSCGFTSPPERQVLEHCFVCYVVGLSYCKKTAIWISAFFVIELLVMGLSFIS